MLDALLKSAILGLSLIISAWITGSHLVAMKQVDGRVLGATGSAVQTVTADKVHWSLDVRAKAPKQAEARDKLLSHVAKVEAFLLKQGMKPEELSQTLVRQQALYQRDFRGNRTNVIEAYEMSRSLEVESSQIEAVTKLSKVVDQLYKEGIQFDAQAPQYFYSKLADLKVALIGQATQNAKERAEAMVAATGNRVSALRSAQTGVFQITPVHSTDVSSWGVHDTSTIEKKVTAVVNAEFSIQ